VANIISPKQNIPTKGIQRLGFLNKTQLMRDFIKGNPTCTKEEAINFIMNTKRAASSTGYSHAATLYRNVMEENNSRDAAEAKRIRYKPNVTSIGHSKSISPVRMLDLVESEAFILEPIPDPSNAEQFERFLVQFKSVCQNPYARGLAKAYIDALDEAALNETKKTS
jgi:hypothetical protein